MLVHLRPLYISRYTKFGGSGVLRFPMLGSALSKRMCSLPSKMTSERLVWIDMEMTGLDPQCDQILEVACAITDGNLSIISENPSIIIHHPESVLKSMNEWCIEHHGKSGLTEASRRSQVTLNDAEIQLLNFIKEYTPPGKCPLAGNTVYMDRLFLQHYMPLVDKHLHYRIVDVSTVKELCRRWYPAQYKATPRKKLEHRALSDIRESIKELQYYQSTIFLHH